MIARLMLLVACASTVSAFAPSPQVARRLLSSPSSPRCAASLRAGALTLSARSSEETCKLVTRSAFNTLLLGSLFAIPITSYAEDADDTKIRAGQIGIREHLIENWTKYAGSGDELNGDNVRRQVGTVGNK
eukprot:754494-Hanusia_phi.AAC.1